MIVPPEGMVYVYSVRFLPERLKSSGFKASLCSKTYRRRLGKVSFTSEDWGKLAI